MSKSLTTFVDMSDQRYDEISDGIRQSYAKSCILWIEEVHNEHLQSAYEAQKLDLIERRGEGKITEKRVYHGTVDSVARIIIREGFNPAANRRSAYGKGVYFARDASYSKEYAPPNEQDGISYLLICDMLFGSVKTYGTNQTIDTTLHDNSMDSSQKIYVTPYAHGAVPRYLVAFYKSVWIKN